METMPGEESNDQMMKPTTKKKRGLFQPEHIIKRGDAMKQFDDLMIDYTALPDVLKYNKIEADHLLFKEAQ